MNTKKILKGVFSVATTITKIGTVIYILYMLQVNLGLNLQTMKILMSILKQNEEALFAMSPAPEA